MLCRQYIRNQQLAKTEELEAAEKLQQATLHQQQLSDSKDVREALKQQKKNRRESLISRGIISRQQKSKKEKQQEEDLQKKTADAELTRLANSDADAYKQQCEYLSVMQFIYLYIIICFIYRLFNSISVY